MTTTRQDRINAEIEADLAELPTAEQIIEQAQADALAPEDLDVHEAEELAAHMATIERYGQFTASGFSPFLVRPVEVDAREYKLANPRVAPPVALRTIQTAMKEAQANPDNVLRRVSLNLSHLDDVQDPYDTPAPHIVAVYTEEGSPSHDRGTVVAAMLYQPTVRVGTDGRCIASYYNARGVSGLVAEFTDYEQAEDAMTALDEATRGMRRLSALRARRNQSSDDLDTETTDRAPRPPKRPVW
jgi:hypothetical protein